MQLEIQTGKAISHKADSRIITPLYSHLDIKGEGFAKASWSLRWAREHQSELMDAWDAVGAGRHPNRIDPPSN